MRATAEVSPPGGDSHPAGCGSRSASCSHTVVRPRTRVRRLVPEGPPHADTRGPAFGPCLLDSRTRSLVRGSERGRWSRSEYEVLHLLARRPQVTLSKDVVIRAGWGHVAVGDNSLENVVGNHRRRRDASDLGRYIRTVPRQGYEFVAGHRGGDGRGRLGPGPELAPHQLETLNASQAGARSAQAAAASGRCPS